MHKAGSTTTSLRSGHYSTGPQGDRAQSEEYHYRAVSWISEHSSTERWCTKRRAQSVCCVLDIGAQLHRATKQRAPFMSCALDIKTQLYTATKQRAPCLLSPISLISPLSYLPSLLSPLAYFPSLLSPLSPISPSIYPLSPISPLSYLPEHISPLSYLPSLLSPLAYLPSLLSPLAYFPSLLSPRLLSPLSPISPLSYLPVSYLPSLLSPLSPISPSISPLSPISPSISPLSPISPLSYLPSLLSPRLLSPLSPITLHPNRAHTGKYNEIKFRQEEIPARVYRRRSGKGHQNDETHKAACNNLSNAFLKSTKIWQRFCWCCRYFSQSILRLTFCSVVLLAALKPSGSSLMISSACGFSLFRKTFSMPLFG